MWRLACFGVGILTDLWSIDKFPKTTKVGGMTPFVRIQQKVKIVMFISVIIFFFICWDLFDYCASFFHFSFLTHFIAFGAFDIKYI